jgi:hypothetical protein
MIIIALLCLSILFFIIVSVDRLIIPTLNPETDSLSGGEETLLILTPTINKISYIR